MVVIMCFYAWKIRIMNVAIKENNQDLVVSKFARESKVLLIYGLLVSMCLMIIAWLIYCRVDNLGLIDVFWGLNITLIGFFYLLTLSLNSLVILIMILLIAWGTRLSLFLLLTRIVKGKKDPRYENMSHGWQNKKKGFLLQYLLQGYLAWLIAIPFYTLRLDLSLSFVTWLAVCLVIVGLLGEVNG